MSDLISRQAAIDMCRKPRMRNADCSDFEMEIMMLPSAEPKRGKWICTGEPDESWGMMFECSICGNHDYGGNYCSYCGAKMEETE